MAVVGESPLGVGQGVVYLGSVVWFSWWLYQFILPAAVNGGSHAPHSCQYLLAYIFLMTTTWTGLVVLILIHDGWGDWTLLKVFIGHLYFYFWELSASLWSPSLLGCWVIFFLFSFLALCVFYTLIFCHMNSWNFFSSNLQFVITQLAVYFVVQMFLIS